MSALFDLSSHTIPMFFNAHSCIVKLNHNSNLLHVTNWQHKMWESLSLVLALGIREVDKCLIKIQCIMFVLSSYITPLFFQPTLMCCQTKSITQMCHLWPTDYTDCKQVTTLLSLLLLPSNNKIIIMKLLTIWLNHIRSMKCLVDFTLGQTITLFLTMR